MGNLTSRHASYAISLGDLHKVMIHYKDSAPGLFQHSDPLVFIHGWGCDMEVWKYQIPLCEHRWCIFIDLPGHGGSDIPVTDYTLDLMAGGIIAVLDELKISKAVLVGHSNGARVCVRVMEKSELASKLMIVDGNLRFPFQNREEAFLELINKLKGKDHLSVIKNLMAEMSGGCLPQDKEMIGNMVEKIPQRILVSTFASMKENVFRKEEKIEIPTFAFISSLNVFGEDYIDFLKGPFSEIEFRLWDSSGASHFIMIQEWEIFNSLLLDFVNNR